MQISRFTIWGRNPISLNAMPNSLNFLKKYVIDKNVLNNIEITLLLPGTSSMSLFPELDSPAKDLEETFEFAYLSLREFFQIKNS
jgi:hypothetical protein